MIPIHDLLNRRVGDHRARHVVRPDLRWFLVLMGLAGLFTGCRSSDLKTPEGIVKSEQRIKLTGKEVAVDFYLPLGVKKAPVVVVAHGFSRSRSNMAGWGGVLASNGFIAVIPDLPAWADHDRNSRAVRELLDRLNSKALVTQPEPNGQGGLMGFSMGGLCTLLAAATNSQVRCWVGLDPVDAGRKGATAAEGVSIPCAVLLAEPSRCNAHGNAARIVASLSGPLFALRVRAATHADPEQPTDWLAELACGKADPKRRQVFERYAVAALKAACFKDAPSVATLAAATNEAAVKDVSIRSLQRFVAKIALVTGAASGIGRATAQRLAQEGARVALADLNQPEVAGVAQAICAGGGQALALRLDVGIHGSVAQASRRNGRSICGFEGVGDRSGIRPAGGSRGRSAIPRQ